MRAEAQFPTPINAILVLGIVATLFGNSYSRLPIKGYAAKEALTKQATKRTDAAD
jgi:hypothetical protein